MLNANGIRELAYIVKVDNITTMDADRLECAHVSGWHCVVGKGEFKIGDAAVYFEIDSKLPEVEPFASMEFLKSKDFKVKTQKIRGEYSQGLLMPIDAFGWHMNSDGHIYDKNETLIPGFVTKLLGVTYAVAADNERKSNGNDKYKAMAQRHSKIARTYIWRMLWRSTFGKKILFAFFGRKKDKPKEWPVGKFPGVSKTDQERCENLKWILNDKAPFIRTQKCDGSSGTYILERKHFGRFEFYVCSRNVRMLNEKQESFYGSHNYYWEVAKKYDIENKMKDYLIKNKDISFVCWQGEVCAPGIQKNPHGLTETHFYCFHMTDSKTGRFDLREAAQIWKEYGMETVPMDSELYIMPDDFEEFKKSADGYYAAEVCEGKKKQAREGYVYYKAGDPNFSFKNVSRKYLMKMGA